jgi:glycosyltransferase involved in cell wall biosynthesis
MISVLISSFNTDVSILVRDLSHQLKSVHSVWEILIHDNGTDELVRKTVREGIVNQDYIRYYSNETSSSRSASRNWLAKKAQYEYLLFMDADAGMVSENFISLYLQSASKEKVIVGGTAYRLLRPKDDQLLRWKYGRLREAIPASKRNQSPWNSFSSFNFLIHKDIAMKIPFDESIQEYGHEDTLLGMEFKNWCIPVIHIANPLFHDGLDNSRVFLEKSRTAVRTLALLIQKGKVDEDITLFRYYHYIKKARLVLFMRWIFSLSKPLLEKQILSSQPSIQLFDLYRLLYLCSLKP